MAEKEQMLNPRAVNRTNPLAPPCVAEGSEIMEIFAMST